MTSQRNTSESWRTRYIRLLTDGPETWDAEPGDFTDEQKLELEAIADLVDFGYMRGRAVRDVNCDVVSAATYGVTLSGRLFAEEQADLLKRRSLWGRIKAGGVLFIGWLSGILSAVIVWYLTK